KAILEPSCVADLVQQFSGALDARDAEEGRSAFSRPNGAAAIGEKIANEKVHIYSDPSHPLVPSGIYGESGLAAQPTDWVRNGKIANGVTNFRWNESPLAMLQNVEDFSKPVVTAPRDGWDGMPMYVPMLYVSGFNFASVSDAI